jgi:hypothetical protein
MRCGFDGVRTVSGESDDPIRQVVFLSIGKGLAGEARNVEKLDQLLFQFAKAGKSS